MFIKDIETVPLSAFKAATWRIFIHQANIFMHWFLAKKRHPTNAKFCQITPDGQLLPWRPDHQPCWRGEQVFPWTRLCFITSDFACEILKAGRHLMIWTACRLALLPTGLGPRSTTSFNCSMTWMDFLMFHVQLLRYPYDLMSIEIILPQVLGHIGQTGVSQRGKEPREANAGATYLTHHLWLLVVLVLSVLEKKLETSHHQRHKWPQG